MLCSESTIIIDASSVTTTLEDNSSVNLSFTTLNTPMVDLIVGNTIDFSNNQPLISNCLFEIYANIDCSFNTDTQKQQGLLCVLTNPANPALNIKVDIRSISNSPSPDVLGFGPRILLFDSGSFVDDKYKAGVYTITLTQTGDAGSSIVINYPVRLIIKQKSLI